MRDDQRPDNPSDPGDRRDAFDDALDDLFGPDTTPEPTAAGAPPPAELPPSPTFEQESYQPQEYRPSESAPPPISTPPQGSSGPGIRGWTWRKAGCYTCLGFFGIIFACLAILFIIGLLSGDTADTGPTGHLWDAMVV